MAARQTLQTPPLFIGLPPSDLAVLQGPESVWLVLYYNPPQQPFLGDGIQFGIITNDPNEKVYGKTSVITADQFMVWYVY